MAERFLSVTFRTDETVGVMNFLAGTTTSLPESIARGLGSAVTINGIGSAVLHNTASQQASSQAMVSGASILSLPEPWVIAHRGAGAMLAPDSILDSYMLGLQWGTGIVDGGDWRTVADGGVYDCHDATLDRITTGTGNVSAATSVQLERITVDASSSFGGGWSDVTGLMTPERFLSRMRGLAVVCPQPNDLTAAARVADVVRRLGMQQMVLPNSFDTTYLAPFVDIGCPAIFRNLTSGEHATYGPAMAATFRAAGITHVGIDRFNANALTAAQAVIDSGLKLVVGTVYKHSHMTPYAGMPVAGWVSDDPVYTHGSPALYQRTTDPFFSNAYFHGHHDRWGSNEPGANRRGVITGGKLLMEGDATDSNFILQGWGEIPDTSVEYTLTITTTLTALTADKTRWPGIIVGCPTDRAVADSGATMSGNQIWVAPSTASGGGSPGRVSIVARTDGANVSSTATGTLSQELTEGTVFDIVINVKPVTASPSTITATIKVSGSTIGSATLTNSTHRGKYWHAGHGGGTVDGLKVTYGPIVRA